MAAASLSRALLRGMLREAGSAPAAFTRHGGAATSARLGVGPRFSSSSAGAAVPPAPPCCSCQKEMAELRRELLEVRRESLNENHHIWNRIDELLKVNHELRDSMVLLRAQSSRNQQEAVYTMVKTSYGILASCGGFVLVLFTVVTPLLKKEWQYDTLELWEKRLRKGAPSKGKGTSGEEEEDDILVVPAESKTHEIKGDGQAPGTMEKGPAVSADDKKKGGDAQQTGTTEKRPWFPWGGNGGSARKSDSTADSAADQNSGKADKGVPAAKETGPKK